MPSGNMMGSWPVLPLEITSVFMKPGGCHWSGLHLGTGAELVLTIHLGIWGSWPWEHESMSAAPAPSQLQCLQE